MDRERGRSMVGMLRCSDCERRDEEPARVVWRSLHSGLVFCVVEIVQCSSTMHVAERGSVIVLHKDMKLSIKDLSFFPFCKRMHYIT